MAKKQQNLGSAKRFGTRYGRSLKAKVAFIEAERRSSTKCPYCSYNKVKRLASGIWFCNKCHTKFTGKAYTISKEIKFEVEKSKTEEQPERAEAERVEMTKQKRAGKTTALKEMAGEEE